MARWNGSSWSPLGSGLANGWFFTGAYGLLQLANGDILATGARWVLAAGDSGPRRSVAGQQWHVGVVLGGPATAALLGAVLVHQLVPFELDASGAIVAVTATDALRLTIGAD